MTTTLHLHFIADEPHILDIDLAAALGMRRPIDIRTGHMVMLRAVLLNCGFLHRDGGAYYLNEQQARSVCHFSTSRRAGAADRCIVETFRQFRTETLPQMDVVDALRQSLVPFTGGNWEGRDGMVIDALKSKLRETVRVRKLASRRRR
ncbi:hypothetical protein DXU02_16150 [Rhizobium leguminosarum]